MTKSNGILCFLLLAMISCTRNKQFDKERWQRNNDVNDTRNPRAYMTNDLLKNHLRVGITKDSIIALLGKPYKDGVENRLPKGIELPDSLSFSKDTNLKKEQKDDVTARINKFVRLNSKLDTLMLYPVGWSTIDPNFLVVKLDKTGKVCDFWIEQH